MKRIKITVTLLLLFSLTTQSGFSQQYFSFKLDFLSALPKTIVLRDSFFNEIMNFKQGESISVKLSDDIIFNGVVVNNQHVYENLKSVLIKSASCNNILLQISKITGKDNCVSYSGRMINMKSSYCYLMSKEDNKNYALNKIELKNVIQDCSF